jgi:hypothetical protein
MRFLHGDSRPSVITDEQTRCTNSENNRACEVAMKPHTLQLAQTKDSHQELLFQFWKQLKSVRSLRTVYFQICLDFHYVQVLHSVVWMLLSRKFWTCSYFTFWVAFSSIRASKLSVNNFSLLFILSYMSFSSSLYTVIYLLQIVSKFMYGYMMLQPFHKT